MIGMVGLRTVIDFIFLVQQINCNHSTSISPGFCTPIPKDCQIYDMICPYDNDNEYEVKAFRIEVVGLGQILTVRLSLASLPMRKRSLGKL